MKLLLTISLFLFCAAAEDVSAPHVVSIHDDDGDFACSGVIIAPQWILTAGLYSLNDLRLMWVVSGSMNYKNPVDMYLVERKVPHCLYDIGLLKLYESITFNDLTRPITMAKENNLNDGDQLTIAGWDSSGALSTAKVSYMNTEKCQQLVGLVREEIICTDSTMVRTSGDYGNALINDENVLVGIKSFISHTSADIHANVAYYYDWIIETMNGTATC